MSHRETRCEVRSAECEVRGARRVVRGGTAMKSVIHAELCTSARVLLPQASRLKPLSAMPHTFPSTITDAALVTALIAPSA